MLSMLSLAVGVVAPTATPSVTNAATNALPWLQLLEILGGLIVLLATTAALFVGLKWLADRGQLKVQVVAQDRLDKTYVDMISVQGQQLAMLQAGEERFRLELHAQAEQLKLIPDLIAGNARIAAQLEAALERIRQIEEQHRQQIGQRDVQIAQLSDELKTVRLDRDQLQDRVAHTERDLHEQQTRVADLERRLAAQQGGGRPPAGAAHDGPLVSIDVHDGTTSTWTSSDGTSGSISSPS